MRDIPGFPAYAVTSEGEVWSWWRANRRNGGSVIDKTRPHRVLRGKRAGSRSEYRSVALCDGERIVYRYIHQLVLEAFVGPCPEGMESRHLDGDPTNNRLENLVYGTWQDNHEDKMRHGRVPHGTTHGMAVLTDELVLEARRRWREGAPLNDLVQLLGVNRGTLHNALIGVTWKHLNEIEAPYSPGRGHKQRTVV